MRLTELFIRRPVLSLVISLAILVAGIRGLLALPVQEYPTTVSATIQIMTSYYGADAATIAGFITTPLENAVAATDGVDFISSQSQSGQSTITLTLKLNQDPNKALTEVQSYVNAATALLPVGFQPPIITSQNNAMFDFAVTLASRTLSSAQVSDYAARVVVPELQSIPGTAQVTNQAGIKLALRVWFDADKLAAYGMTATDAVTALQNNSTITGVGQTLGGMTFDFLAVNSDLHTLPEFRHLVIRDVGGVLVRLGDVADVEFGTDTTNINLDTSEGQGGAFISIGLTPTANLLATARAVEAAVQRIAANVPPGIDCRLQVNDADFVNASRHETLVSLAEALAIVALVIFLFLGNLRSVLVPLVTIPLSLIGTFALMAILGFSINLLTLLAMVLAIGLVVDDAIIIVENVNRHLALGRSPTESAVIAARELGGPIVAMTVVLIAAYLPVGLRKGLTGALFTEFAFTLAASVTVSAILALTLSPMMSARLLRPPRSGRSLAGLGVGMLAAFQRLYSRVLARVLDVWPLAILAGLAVLASIPFLFAGAAHELAPQEDKGIIIISGQNPPNAGLDQLVLYDPQVAAALSAIPEGRSWWNIDLPGQINEGTTLKPWDQRTRDSDAIQAQLQTALSRVAGLQFAVFQPPSLPGAQGLPIQFVIEGSGPIDQLAAVSDRLLVKARQTGLFAYIDKDLKIDQPQTTIELDRNRISELGLDVATITSNLNWLLGGNFVNYFSVAQRSYRVLPMVTRTQRLNPDQILNYPIADIGGVPIRLASVATLSHQVVPEQITHFQQRDSATLQAIPMPGVTTDRAYATLTDLARTILPAGYATDTSGPLREYVTESGGFVASFAFAIVIIYLALAALFESFRDPLVILVSVPMSIAGALFVVWLGPNGATINLYSEIGLVTLAGLISKHGILIVEVANEQQQAGLTKRQAIERAAALRLRPILMTTAAMVLGVMPLLFATGAGAHSRFAMGLVIASGLGIGTIFTLFIVPSVYLLVAARHAGASDRQSARQEQARGAAP
jgi:multidrug efflux pump